MSEKVELLKLAARDKDELIDSLVAHIEHLEKHLTPMGRAIFGLCSLDQAVEESKEHHEIKVIRNGGKQ